MDFCKIFKFDGITVFHSKEDDASSRQFERHCHAHYEIIYMVTAEGKYVCDGAKYPISENTLIIIPPCHYHYVEPKPNTAYERFVLSFSSDLISSDVLRVAGIDFLNKISYFDKDSLPGSVNDMFLRFEKSSSFEGESKRIMGKLILCELLITLSHNAICNAEEKEENALGARVAKYLNDKISSKITLDEIAHDFFVSKSYLCRAFKEYNGVSVLSYINAKRVAMARKLIEEGQTASVAAYNVGFLDYSTFFRAYKRTSGKSPSNKSIK